MIEASSETAKIYIIIIIIIIISIIILNVDFSFSIFRFTIKSITTEKCIVYYHEVGGHLNPV